MLGLIGRAAVLVLVVVSLGARPAAAGARCPAPDDPRQAELDQAGLAGAQAGGLSLSVVRQCAGFSVIVQDGIDPAAAADYATQAEQVYARLASETGNTLSPRAVLFVFADQAGMAAAERVVGGITRPAGEPRAGYAWMNTIWLDNSQHRSASARAQAVAHEFSHLFAAVAARGEAIPAWFNEGLAVDGEVALPAEAFPAASDALAGSEREAVLDALSGRGPVDLFALAELETGRAWQQHYADAYEQRLEYAQAYQTVRAAMGGRGRAAAWKVLHELGANGGDFAAAFQAGFAQTVEQVDAAARAAWHAEVEAPPDPLRLEVRIAPGGDPSEVRLDVMAFAGQVAWHASGAVMPGSSVALQVQPDGTLTQASGDLFETLETLPFDLSDQERSFDTSLSLGISRADGGVEKVSFVRTYGRWRPVGQRVVIGPHADNRVTSLAGPVSDPFPSGDIIVASGVG